MRERTYTNKWYKYLARIFILIINHGLGDWHLRTWSTTEHILVQAICYFNPVVFGVSGVQSCYPIAQLLPGLSTKEGTVCCVN